MTDKIKEFVTQIDLQLSSLFTGKYYGLAELLDGQNETFPSTIAARRDRISPADTWQLQTYHRMLNGSRGDQSEAFGKQLTYLQPMTMIMISNVNLGEDLIYRMLESLPELVKVTGAYAVVEDAASVRTDLRSIITTEFGSAWIDKVQVTKNINAIDYTLKVTLCQ